MLTNALAICAAACVGALLIVFVVWVLVAGWATATECAAYGVLGSLAIAAAGGSLTWAISTTRTTKMPNQIRSKPAFSTVGSSTPMVSTTIEIPSRKQPRTT